MWALSYFNSYIDAAGVKAAASVESVAFKAA